MIEDINKSFNQVISIQLPLSLYDMDEWDEPLKDIYYFSL